MRRTNRCAGLAFARRTGDCEDQPMSITLPARAAAVVVAAVLALAGCTSSPEATPTPAREFCVIAKEMVDDLLGGEMTAFAQALAGGSSSDTGVADVKSAADAAASQYATIAELMREAAAVKGPGTTADALGVLANGYDKLAKEITTDFADVATADDVATASNALNDAMAPLAQDGTLDDAAKTVGDAVEGECNLSLDSGTEVGKTDAMSLVSTFGKEIATFMVDWDGVGPFPELVERDGYYWLDGYQIAQSVDGLSLTDVEGTDSTDWCAEVTVDATGEAYSYSAMEGLLPLTCAEATT